MPALFQQSSAFSKKGCYVFAVGAPRGCTPIYVGRTTKSSLKKEAFNDRNQKVIDRYLNDRAKHRDLLIFLITQSTSKGKPNLSAIGEIEDFLIANAAVKNKQLINKKGVVKEKWSIRGVYNTGIGKPENAARQLKAALGIRKR